MAIIFWSAPSKTFLGQGSRSFLLAYSSVSFRNANTAKKLSKLSQWKSLKKNELQIVLSHVHAAYRGRRHLPAAFLLRSYANGKSVRASNETK
jgi:hypothetical protein